MRKVFHFITLIILTFCIARADAYAGSQQLGSKTNHTIEEVVPFAKQVEKYAASKGARVFILARLGSPQSLLPEGIEFTHVGLAVYSNIETSNGEVVKGYAIHNLYQKVDRPDISYLVTDYPVDFFSGVEELKAGVIVPVPKLQDKILRSLALGRDRQLHNPRYSIAANPYSKAYQNCTEHTLDILFASIYGTDSVAQIKANQQTYFKAQHIEISPIKRFLAPLVSSAVNLSDHEEDVRVATFTSIANFLGDHELSSIHAVINNEGIKEYN